MSSDNIEMELDFPSAYTAFRNHAPEGSTFVMTCKTNGRGQFKIVLEAHCPCFEKNGQDHSKCRLYAEIQFPKIYDSLEEATKDGTAIGELLAAAEGREPIYPEIPQDHPLASKTSTLN
jgi:hypothetical protein